jgi:hypothetical protein
VTGRLIQTLVLVARWTDREPPPHLLAAAEQRLAARFPPRRRREWTAARLTARAALHLVFGALPPRSAILSAPDGAPRLIGSGAGCCTVSLAHSDDWVACACGPAYRALGIDIEKSGACDAELLARVSEPRELPVPAQSATVGWARKEAAFKACRGVPPLLAGYRLMGPTRVAAVRPGQADRMLTTWSVELPGAVLAVAEDHSSPPRLQILEVDDVLTLLEGPNPSFCAPPIRSRAG